MQKIDFNKIYNKNCLEGMKLIPKNKIKIRFDLSKPNGTPRKVLDISLAKKYGWRPKIKLKEAILKTYYNYIKQKNK